jgi:hypothetical protein
VIVMPMQTKMPRASAGTQRSRWSLRPRYKASTAITPKSARANGIGRYILLRISTPAGGNVCDDAVVLTVTIAVVAVPFNEIMLGDTLHMDFAGAPLHVSVTLWLNPPPGATEIV